MAAPSPHPQAKKIVTNPFIGQHEVFTDWNAMSDAATIDPCGKVKSAVANLQSRLRLENQLASEVEL